MATDTIWRQSAVLRDAKGWIGRVNYNVAGDSSVSTNEADMTTVITTFVTALLGLSNCVNQQKTFPYTHPTLAYGANSEYPAEWMKAVMTFTTDAGNITRFKVPAPKIAIFDTDGITVKNDGSVAAVVAFVNAVKNPVNSAFVSTVNGLPYTHFVGGILRLGKQPRRFNEFVKSAGLVAGEGE